MAQGVAGRDGDIHGFRDQEKCRVMRKVYAASGVGGIVKDVHSIKAHVYPRDQRCDQESRKWTIFFASTHCIVAVCHLFSMSSRRRASTSCGLDCVDARLPSIPSTPSASAAASVTLASSIASTARAAFNITKTKRKAQVWKRDIRGFRCGGTHNHRLSRPVGSLLYHTLMHGVLEVCTLLLS
jgi:hypothetical protein